MTVADLDALRDRLERALAHVERMTAAKVAERAGIEPDAYSTTEDIEAGTNLDEAMDLADSYDPVEVRGWAIVQRFWAVRVPIGDDGGHIEGHEIMRFDAKEQADAFVASAMSDPPGGGA